jgi:hypothetical protein
LEEGGKKTPTLPQPHSYGGQPISSKNAAKGALNLRGEAIASFHLPSKSLSSPEAEFSDQAHKEVPTGKMGRIVETIDQ